MEYTYKAYTRQVNEQNFYFVKRYATFTDLENAPKILDTMGMHTNFFKACKLAGITDEATVQELSSQVYIPARETKEYTLQKVSNSIWRNAQHFLAKLRLAGMN